MCVCMEYLAGDVVGTEIWRSLGKALSPTSYGQGVGLDWRPDGGQHGKIAMRFPGTEKQQRGSGWFLTRNVSVRPW